jgi:Dual specificity phosphatase, catalytic domain
VSESELESSIPRPFLGGDVPDELRNRGLASRMVEDALRFARKGVARVLELAPTKMNFSWVTDELGVGGVFRRSDIPRLRRMGVNAVVDCRAEGSDDQNALRRHGIDFLWLPAPDTHEISQEALDRGVVWVRERIGRGQRVYVHCLHGVGRGPLLGACVLVSSGYSATQALQRVKARRWQASPNEEQIAALVTYARRHRDGQLSGQTEQ